MREAILLSIIPGLLAAAAIVYDIRHAPRLERRERQPIRLRLRPVMHGRLGRLMLTVGAFEFGNIAATLLILRATELFEPDRSTTSATQLALVLHTAYNLAATLISVPAGRAGDRLGTTRVLTVGAALFLLAYAGFAAAGLGIGCAEAAEAAEHAAVASSRPKASAARRSACSPRCRAPATSPPAQSPARYGRWVSPCRSSATTAACLTGSRRP